MKRTKIKIIALLGLALTLGACNHIMDTQPSTSYSESIVWSNRTTANSFVYNVYGSVFGGYIGMSNSMYWEDRTPNGISTVDGMSQNWFNQNNYQSDQDFVGVFGSYGTVRAINMIIEKAQEYKGKGLSDVDTKELVAEGKFLRAMHYYRQARAIGRIVYIDKVLSPADTAGDGLKKYVLTKTVDESYDLIIKDLEEAMADMTTIKVQGRANKWAAYALMTEVSLTAAAYVPAKATTYLNKGLAAGKALLAQSGYALHPTYSDLFNDKVNSAVGEIILARYYDYTLTTVGGTEMQYTSPNASNDQVRTSYASPFFKVDKAFEAWPTQYPTQNLADAYLMVDKTTGKAVNWKDASQVKAAINFNNTSTIPAWITKTVDGKKIGTGGTDRTSQTQTQIEDNYKAFTNIQYSATVKNPMTDITSIIYADRDARMAATLVLDGTEWNGETASTRFFGNLNRWTGGNGSMAYYRTATNYYWRKYFYNTVENKVIFVSNKTAYHRIIFRLGRVVMNLAEIQLRLADLGAGATYAEAVATINQTRTIHGQLPASAAATATDAWKDYITERRCELAMEGDLYWAAIRWGIYGGNANNGTAPKGDVAILLEEPTLIEIAPDGSGFVVAPVNYLEINKRSFRADRQYLLPIPQGTLNAYPFLGTQNPGW